jgi:hypothetical protein
MNDAQQIIAYFGYGSLVNRATLGPTVIDAVPARLKGRSRHWRPRPDMPGFPAALLTILPEDGCVVDGLLVFDSAANLPAIDRREARYERHVVTSEELELLGPAPGSCAVYVYQAISHLPPHKEEPRILQSYLDVVLQGFLQEHGRAGVERFIAETRNFHIEVLTDRSRPIYPRAVSLTAQEAEYFDALLEKAEVKYIEPR